MNKNLSLDFFNSEDSSKQNVKIKYEFRADFKWLFKLRRQKKISPTASDTFLLLYDVYKYQKNRKIDSNGEYITYKQEKLAKELECDERSVRRAIKELTEIGLLKMEKSNIKNKYYLLM